MAAEYNNNMHIFLYYNNSHYIYNDSTGFTADSTYSPLTIGNITVYNNNIHAIGSKHSSSINKHYKYDGSTWTKLDDLPYYYSDTFSIGVKDNNTPLPVLNNKIYLPTDYNGNGTLQICCYDGSSYTYVSEEIDKNGNYGYCMTGIDDKLYFSYYSSGTSTFTSYYTVYVYDISDNTEKIYVQLQSPSYDDQLWLFNYNNKLYCITCDMNDVIFIKMNDNLIDTFIDINELDSKKFTVGKLELGYTNDMYFVCTFNNYIYIIYSLTNRNNFNVTNKLLKIDNYAAGDSSMTYVSWLCSR